MKLIATRHAETNYNIKDLVNYDPTVAQPDPVSARYLDKFESVSDMTIRVQKFIDYLKQHHKSNETILIVTSSHIIKQLRMLYGEITMEELLNAPAKHATYYEFNL